MQPFLLLFGTSLLTLAKAVTMTKILAFLCATAGSILVAVANRGRIPLLKKLPRFVAPGSTEALILSLVLLIVGGTATAAGMTGDFSPAFSIVAGAFGGACLLFFDRNDLTGITKGGPGPTAFALLVLVALLTACYKGDPPWPYGDPTQPARVAALKATDGGGQ